MEKHRRPAFRIVDDEAVAQLVEAIVLEALKDAYSPDVCIRDEARHFLNENIPGWESRVRLDYLFKSETLTRIYSD